jgi:very-short-patch-repair endonuclease
MDVEMQERIRHSPRIRGTSREIDFIAKQMRNDMTQAELALWERLKSKQLDGFKFRAQHPVGPFILDFYCPAKKLVVELDGDIHARQKEYDRARTEQLEAHDYTVIRFSNDQVLKDIESVVEEIRRVLQDGPPLVRPR